MKIKFIKNKLKLNLYFCEQITDDLNLNDIMKLYFSAKEEFKKCGIQIQHDQFKITAELIIIIGCVCFK